MRYRDTKHTPSADLPLEELEVRKLAYRRMVAPAKTSGHKAVAARLLDYKCIWTATVCEWLSKDSKQCEWLGDDTDSMSGTKLTPIRPLECRLSPPPKRTEGDR
jgi:hypothetical protein